MLARDEALALALDVTQCLHPDGIPLHPAPMPSAHRMSNKPSNEQKLHKKSSALDIPDVDTHSKQVPISLQAEYVSLRTMLINGTALSTVVCW